MTDFEIPRIKIIPDTKEDRKRFNDENWGAGCGDTEVILTPEQIQALHEGKCVAIDDGEYSTFLTAQNSES